MSGKFLDLTLDGALEAVSEIVAAKDSLKPGNSFFDQSYFGTRVLIIVPKPGDEILVAGNMILNFVAARAEVFIAYAEKKYFSLEALKILGVAEKNVIFFGGKAELKNLIADLQANIIFCADFDSKIQYKNLSADFEEVLGEILKSDAFYRPEVYKKFARATALHCPPDFYSQNLLSTKRPKVGATNEYSFDVIDRANYSWQNRVRFPVPESCQVTLLKGNPLSMAVEKYQTQRHGLDVLKILNGDEVCFERRTDNQAYSAQISEQKAADFKILDTAQTDDLIFVWAEGVQVQRIVIYGNYKDEDTAKIKISLELDNVRAKIESDRIYLESNVSVEKILPGRGRPLVINTEKIFVRRAEIKILECGKKFGIGEIEFFANRDPLRKIQPFIKLTVNDQFVYKYFVPRETENILFGLYRFHIAGPLRMIAESGDQCFLNEVWSGEGEFVLHLQGKKEFILTAEVVDKPSIYDRIIIRRVKDVGQIQFKMAQWTDKVAFAIK